MTRESGCRETIQDSVEKRPALAEKAALCGGSILFRARIVVATNSAEQ